jgi:hypothetical protein
LAPLRAKTAGGTGALEDDLMIAEGAQDFRVERRIALEAGN